MTKKQAAKPQPQVRKGQGSMQVGRPEFERRLREHYYDPAFEQADGAIKKLADLAWDGNDHSRKSPRTRKAGPGFADPEYELAIEWLATRDAIAAAQKRHDKRSGKPRILLICASPRNDQTCPGEMSKTFRLAKTAREVIEAGGAVCDLLDLSHITAQYARHIHPCKACVSTAMPLCHWPCSCYPNHALGQVNDWMSELYPRWVEAHGVMIVTPVHWYQAPTVLKAMIDRLVCADGGNPDPTSTHGKKPAEAKALELKGWGYPRHLAGRAFAVVVHGDTEGVDTLRRSLVDWLNDMELIQAGRAATLDRYIGYYGPYATSHDALDADQALFEETRNAARSLVSELRMIRKGRREPDAELESPRPK